MTEDVDGIAHKSTAAWRAVLEDPEVRAWHDKLAMGSELTADEYARVLDRYCTAVNGTPTELNRTPTTMKRSPTSLNTTPAALVARAKDQDGGRRAIEHQLQDFVIRMRKSHKPSSHGEDDGVAESVRRCARGHMPGYVNRFPKVIRSYLDHHDIVLRKIFVGDTDSAPSVEDELLLTPAQLREIVTAASPRGRVIVALVAWGCLRPEVLGNHDATDGLVIGDLADLDLTDDKVKITRHPMQIVVRRQLSKIRKRYLTFLCGEGAMFLQDYLERRKANGEHLTKDSPIVRPDYNRERQGRPAQMRGSLFLETAAITSEVRVTLRACGLHVRPYALRNYAVSRFESALRDGKISLHDKLFFEGRKTAIDLRYSHHKQLSQETVEELRASYAKAEPYLGAKPSPSPNELRISIPDLQATAPQLEAILVQLSGAIALAKKEGRDVGFTVNVHPTD